MDLLELQQINRKLFRRHPWELAREKVLHFLLVKCLPVKACVADIGSGDAFLAKSMATKQPTWNVAAVDTNYTPEVLNHIDDGKPSNICFLSHVQEVPFQFLNGAVLMDVLEHIKEPESLLHEVNQLISKAEPNCVFVTVPAYQWLFGPHDERLGHYRRYNRKELATLLKGCDLEVLQSGYFFSSLFLVRVIQKLLRKTGSSNELYNWKGNRFITRLLTFFFYTEFKIAYYLSRFGIHLPGLTAYCLCRKRLS